MRSLLNSRLFAPAILLALLLVAIFGQVPAQGYSATSEDVETWIAHYAALEGASVWELTVTGECESQLNPYPKDGYSGEIGPFQFLPVGGVWRVTPQAQAGEPIRDPEVNTAAAAWAFGIEGRNWGSRHEDLRLHWSCYKSEVLGWTMRAQTNVRRLSSVLHREMRLLFTIPAAMNGLVVTT